MGDVERTPARYDEDVGAGAFIDGVFREDGEDVFTRYRAERLRHGIDEERAAFAREPSRLGDLLLETISARAGLGWTTTGHTAIDVNLYAAGPGAERFRGHHDNTAVGALLADLMGFDLEALTQALRAEIGSQ